MFIPGSKNIVEVMRSKGCDVYANNHRLGLEWDELLERGPSEGRLYGVQYVVVTEGVKMRIKDRSAKFEDCVYYSSPLAALFFPSIDMVAMESVVPVSYYRSSRLIAATEGKFPVGIVWPERTVKLLSPVIKGDCGPSHIDCNLADMVEVLSSLKN